MKQLQSFNPISCALQPDFQRADLEIYGINHFRPSYAAHFFCNDDALTLDNATPSRSSYMGSIHVFGHAQCVGDDGHCQIPSQIRRFDDRPSHPLTRAFKRLTITDALRRALAKDTVLQISVLCETRPFDQAKDAEPYHNNEKRLFDYQGMQLVTFS